VYEIEANYFSWMDETEVNQINSKMDQINTSIKMILDNNEMSIITGGSEKRRQGSDESDNESQRRLRPADLIRAESLSLKNPLIGRSRSAGSRLAA
jgi:hypothetical protein